MIKRYRNLGSALGVLVLTMVFSAALWAQSSEGILSGQVTDQSGGVIPAIHVTLVGPGGAAQTAQTDSQGHYAFRHLSPGDYTVRVAIKGFAPFEKTGVEISAGRTQTVNAQLVVAMETQKVNVEAEANHVGVTAESNVSALVLKGKDLDALSDDPDELSDELQALAGPSAGPNGGQIYIDGFTGGQLPPKSAILEVHVNQNPFSAQYDKLGYGRIEITTKPGAQQFHGQAMADGNDSLFNSRNPFVADIPSYHSEFYNANLGGPMGKKAAFFFDFFRRDIQDNSIVDAVVLDPTLSNQVSFRQAVPNPQVRTNLGPRADFQLGTNNVLTVRYQFWQNSRTNAGIGQINPFLLPSQAYNSGDTEHTVQVSDTQVVSAKTVNQTRFEFRHEPSSQTPISLDPQVNVIGAFTSGGSLSGTSQLTENHYEFQNMTSMSLGKHSVSFGGRLRDDSEYDNSNAGYNASFTFDSLANYQVTQQDLAANMTLAQIQAAGYGPNQFVITAGNPIARVRLFDVGVYGEDEWRVRPNVSLTAGLRFESQNHISDHTDFAPRLGLAWGIGKGARPKTVLRAGFGIFYDRFDELSVLQAERLNGINQQQYVITNPPFFSPVASGLPSIATIQSLSAATLPAIYQIDPTLRSPYVLESALGLERQLNTKVTASVTYINTHGVHQLLTRNINAPLPGTYVDCTASSPQPCTPSPGVRPLGDVGNIYQYESAGIFNENQLISNFNVRAGTRLSLFGFYTLSYANGDASGGFPMNQYNIREDYGTSAFAIRNRVFMGGSLGLMRGIRLSPFMVFASGRPYNVTIGQDLNGDSIFNDRPAFAAPGATGPNIRVTPFGTFDLAPAPGAQIIPINYLIGPSQFSLNMRLAKTFGFGRAAKGSAGDMRGGFRGGPGGGPHGGPGGLGPRGLSGGGGGPGAFFGAGNAENRRYQLEVSLNSMNIINKVNLGTPVGNLSSPIFGQSNSLAGGFFGSQSANRRLDLMLRFTF